MELILGREDMIRWRRNTPIEKIEPLFFNLPCLYETWKAASRVVFVDGDEQKVLKCNATNEVERRKEG